MWKFKFSQFDQGKVKLRLSYYTSQHSLLARKGFSSTLSHTYGIRTSLLTNPLSRCHHLVPLSECIVATLSSSTHSPINDDTRYLYVWIDRELLDSQRA